MKTLDEILELLQDSQWHSLDEIRAKVSISEDTFKKIIHFLEEQELINLDKNEGRAKIKPLGLTFLELPMD